MVFIVNDHIMKNIWLKVIILYVYYKILFKFSDWFYATNQSCSAQHDLISGPLSGHYFNAVSGNLLCANWPVSSPNITAVSV